MLIKNAEIYQAGLHDLRIENGIIAEIGHLSPRPGETVVNAAGGALLPGLHDHHLHFLSYAAALASLDCSPAAVADAKTFAAQLQRQASGTGWLRGFGYHESVAGDIDCHWIDQYCPNRPVRIQHRTGRLWIYNSAGLAILRAALSQQTGEHTLPPESFQSGRFYDANTTLAALQGRQLPAVRPASKELASYGVTGFTDMTPTNDRDALMLFKQLRADGSVLQHVHMALNAALEPDADTTATGPVKIHLHENRLPPLDELVERIQAAHQAGTIVAIHCVTEIELLFSLAALEDAGVTGDRIEHASVTPDHALERMAALGLTVVTQPHFIQEKGDTYLSDIEAADHAALYRCRTFLDWNIPLAAGSDAPFGSADPWAAMRAAVSRRTAAGHILGECEALSPEQAIALFVGSPQRPAEPRIIQPGAAADLCLLRHPWAIARTRLTAEDVRAAWREGVSIYGDDL